jgi:hypothetical protein
MGLLENILSVQQNEKIWIALQSQLKIIKTAQGKLREPNKLNFFEVIQPE